MKNKIFAALTFLASTGIMACPLCDAKQPKGFENITHGEGPEGNVDYIIMYAAIIIVGYTLFMSVKYLIKPKENDSEHIKNIVVDH